MAALSSSTVAPCCVKGAVVVNRKTENRRNALRSGMWQIGCCPLRCDAKIGAAAVVSKRRGVVVCAAAATSTGMIRVVNLGFELECLWLGYNVGELRLMKFEWRFGQGRRTYSGGYQGSVHSNLPKAYP